MYTDNINLLLCKMDVLMRSSNWNTMFVQSFHYHFKKLRVIRVKIKHISHYTGNTFIGKSLQIKYKTTFTVYISHKHSNKTIRKVYNIFQFSILTSKCFTMFTTSLVEYGYAIVPSSDIWRSSAKAPTNLFNVFSGTLGPYCFSIA